MFKQEEVGKMPKAKYDHIYKDLKEKIEYIISHYDTAIQKAENALKYVCNTYDVSITANKYLKEYSKIKP